MSKKLIVGSLTVVCLPLGVVASAAATALLAATLILISPIVIFGCAVRVGGELSNIVLERYYSSNGKNLGFNKTNDSLYSKIKTSLSLTALFTILSLVPVALGLAALAAVLLPINFLALTVWLPYKAIDRGFSYFEQPLDDVDSESDENIYTTPPLEVHSAGEMQNGKDRDHFHSIGKLRFFNDPRLILSEGYKRLEESVKSCLSEGLGSSSNKL